VTYDEREKCWKCGHSYSLEFTLLKEFQCPLCRGAVEGAGWHCNDCQAVRFSLETDSAHRAGPQHQKWLAVNETTREEVVQAAREEAAAIRKAAREDAEAEQQRAKKHALLDYDEQVRAKRVELERVTREYEGELDRIAMNREDRVLWDASPAEIKTHFAYVEDVERRTDLAIAVLLHRGEPPARVAGAFYVTVGRVEKVLRGDGVKDSDIETVRSMVGPRPDGGATPHDGPTPSTPEEPVPKQAKSPQDRDAVRSTAFRMFDEGAHVRPVARAIGKSVGFAQKLRAEWVAERSATKPLP